ncbi:MAG: glycosyl hydrolase [Lacipirellulaceae bacterium]
MGIVRREWLLFVWVVCLAGSVSVVSGAERRASKKKGFCVTTKKGSDWQKKISALDAKWFYSWGAQKPKQVPRNVEFTPMIWGRYALNSPKTLANLKAQGNRKEVRFLLGFNEPDQPKQSNLSVEEVIALWPQLEAIGLPLGSPGCVHPDRDWMNRFMAEVEAKNLRVDFICVHSYGGPSAKAFVKRLRDIHENFQRPIWITEFAVGDWTAKTANENKHSPKRVAQFMRELLPMLENLDFVHRYAWFSASTESAALGTSALFHKDGSLTELGRIYRDF